MAGIMVSDGQLYRVARGVYGLHPELAAAFEAARSPVRAEAFIDPEAMIEE
jgi:hypothetical protein